MSPFSSLGIINTVPFSVLSFSPSGLELTCTSQDLCKSLWLQRPINYFILVAIHPITSCLGYFDRINPLNIYGCRKLDTGPHPISCHSGQCCTAACLRLSNVNAAVWFPLALHISLYGNAAPCHARFCMNILNVPPQWRLAQNIWWNWGSKTWVPNA